MSVDSFKRITLQRRDCSPQRGTLRSRDCSSQGEVRRGWGIQDKSRKIVESVRDTVSPSGSSPERGTISPSESDSDTDSGSFFSEEYSCSESEAASEIESHFNSGSDSEENSSRREERDRASSPLRGTPQREECESKKFGLSGNFGNKYNVRVTETSPGVKKIVIKKKVTSNNSVTKKNKYFDGYVELDPQYLVHLHGAFVKYVNKETKVQNPGGFVGKVWMSSKYRETRYLTQNRTDSIIIVIPNKKEKHDLIVRDYSWYIKCDNENYLSIHELYTDLHTKFSR